MGHIIEGVSKIMLYKVKVNSYKKMVIVIKDLGIKMFHMVLVYKNSLTETTMKDSITWARRKDKKDFINGKIIINISITLVDLVMII